VAEFYTTLLSEEAEAMLDHQAACLLSREIWIVIVVICQVERLGVTPIETDLAQVLPTCQDVLLWQIGQMSLDQLVIKKNQLVVKEATILKTMRCQTYLERSDEQKQRRPNLLSVDYSRNP